jgi:hypothetical protein
MGRPQLVEQDDDGLVAVGEDSYPVSFLVDVSDSGGEIGGACTSFTALVRYGLLSGAYQ